MFNVTRRVSFSIAIAMTVGWGTFFLLFMTSSNILLEAEQQANSQTGILPRGVKLRVQVDKQVYRSGDTVLVAIRNDSRLPIWIRKFDTDCASAWWNVERLESDGESWSSAAVSSADCTPIGLVRFANHSLKSGEWKTAGPDPSADSQPENVQIGTYRISVPYLKGKTITADTPWTTAGVTTVSSVPFAVL